MEELHTPDYCCYRIQAQKRFGRGEDISKTLDFCLRECKGYDHSCRNYTPINVNEKSNGK